jgi:hypothetical protein
MKNNGMIPSVGVNRKQALQQGVHLTFRTFSLTGHVACAVHVRLIHPAPDP